jgi:hypothetical protein
VIEYILTASDLFYPLNRRGSGLLDELVVRP